MTWRISKEFDFCYGHRVWSQELNVDFSMDPCLKCRHLHGHQGKVIVYLESNNLKNGMVTDFKHLNWFKHFLDDVLDHKFIIDINDPLFETLLPHYKKEELIKNVSISLMKQIMQKPAVGWVRGDKVGSEEALSKELTSLSKENRQLREKISDLESRISPKTPVIELTVKFPTVDEKFDEFERLVSPDKVDINDIEEHLLEFISSDDIEKYNNGLPTELEIGSYNSKLEKIYKLDNYSIPLVIDVNNRGSMKANNLFIDIIFPEGIFVYRKGKEFSEPKNPLPFNPIKRAQSKYQEKQKEALRKLKQFSSLNEMLGLNDNRVSALSMIPHSGLNIPNIRPINQNWWTKLDGNKLTIKLSDLLHTRRRTFDDEYMIVPLASGCHRIEVKTICEEYENIDIQIIEMAV